MYVCMIDYCFIASVKCRHVERAAGDFPAGDHCRHQLCRYRVAVSLTVISYHCYHAPEYMHSREVRVEYYQSVVIW